MDFRKLRKTPPTERRTKIAYGFSIGNNFEERVSCLRALRSHPLAQALPQPLNGRLYLKELATYRFVASPEGNGIDCHRTWEALLLGVIPIVTRSYLTEHFRELGLPLMLLDSWEDLCKWDTRSLDGFYDEKRTVLDHPTLFWNYWEKAVRASLRPF